MKNKLYELLKNNNIAIDEDVFYYGLSLLKKYFIFLIVTLFLSLYLNIFLEVLFFIILYIPLRRYVGGFHFNNSKICIFFSIVISIVACYISKQINFSINTIVISYICLTILIIKYVPVDHKNKRLSSREKYYYKKKALIVNLLYFIITVFFKLLHLNELSSIYLTCTYISLLSLSLSCIIKYKYHLLKT